MTPADSKTIDDLREAYRETNWLQRFFLGRIVNALMQEGLPPIEKASGRPTPYTSAQARTILTAFTETNWLSKLLFRGLRAFKASPLFNEFRRNPSYLAAQDVTPGPMEDTTGQRSTTSDSLLSFPSPPLAPVTELDTMNDTPTASDITVRDTTDRISTVSDALFQSNDAGVGSFLRTQDKALFSRTSRLFHGLFKPALQEEKLKKIVSKLLQHVVRGKQKEVEEMLQSQPAISLALLLKKGDVTDYSDRTFHDASPLQCLLWTRDTHYMGNVILHSFLENPLSDEIREDLAAQLKTMQAGGRDLVKMDRNPTTMPPNELLAFVTGAPDPVSGVINPRSVRADNKDVLIYHWDAAREEGQLYYYTDGTVEPFAYEPTDENDAFMALFRLMDINSAKKSNDAEHALITRATGKTLSRNGIHYSQPAACKALVKLGGTVNPGDITFADIGRLFNTPDALLFWNNQFYYASKADSSVTPIAPAHDLSPEQSTALTALKATLTTMINHQSRLPSTLEEHRLINTLFREHPAFQPTHHCESHYDFGIIDALQAYVDRFDGLDWNQRDAFWINLVAKIQRLAPAHVLQHYCDPDRAFYPLPDFKAATFKRESRFYSCWATDKWSNLFSSGSLDSGFGFQFDLYRGSGRVHARYRAECDAPHAGLDLSALRGLCEVRTNDARLLHDQLHQSLVPAPSGPTGAGDPS